MFSTNEFTLPILNPVRHADIWAKKKPLSGLRVTAGDFLLHRQHVYPFARPIQPVEVHHAVD
jgi:hypothetical protein